MLFYGHDVCYAIQVYKFIASWRTFLISRLNISKLLPFFQGQLGSQLKQKIQLIQQNIRGFSKHSYHQSSRITTSSYETTFLHIWCAIQKTCGDIKNKTKMDIITTKIKTTPYDRLSILCSQKKNGQVLRKQKESV